MRVQSASKSPHFLAFFGWLVNRKSEQEEGTAARPRPTGGRR